MTAWDIEVTGVRSVVDKTVDAAETIGTVLTEVATALEGGATNSASQLVANAVSGFATSIKDDIEDLMKQASAAIQAAIDATNAYVQGDLEMAQNAQHLSGQD